MLVDKYTSTKKYLMIDDKEIIDKLNDSEEDKLIKGILTCNALKMKDNQRTNIIIQSFKWIVESCKTPVREVVNFSNILLVRWVFTFTAHPHCFQLKYYNVNI
jgi:hypothetical protein